MNVLTEIFGDLEEDFPAHQLAKACPVLVCDDDVCDVLMTCVDGFC